MGQSKPNQLYRPLHLLLIRSPFWRFPSTPLHPHIPLHPPIPQQPENTSWNLAITQVIYQSSTQGSSLDATSPNITSNLSSIMQLASPAQLKHLAHDLYGSPCLDHRLRSLLRACSLSNPRSARRCTTSNKPRDRSRAPLHRP